MIIKAKRTTYQAITFRSKLESRWARFLDILGIGWEYEPELVDLGEGLKYLPDFRVSSSYWLEIKGDMGDDANGMTIVSKCERLAVMSSLPVILAFYDPFAAKCAAFLPDGGMYQAHFGMCPECGGLAVKASNVLLCSHPNGPMSLSGERNARRRIFDAAVAARDWDSWSNTPVQ